MQKGEYARLVLIHKKSTDIVLCKWYLWQHQKKKKETQTLLIFLFPCSTPPYSLANAICGMLTSKHPRFI